MSDNEKAKGKCAKCGAPIYEGDNFCDQCSEKITHCPKCGAIMSECAKFCMKCGYSTIKKCACGAIMPEDALFCLECGAKLDSDTPYGGSAPVAAGTAASASAPAPVVAPASASPASAATVSAPSAAPAPPRSQPAAAPSPSQGSGSGNGAVIVLLILIILGMGYMIFSGRSAPSGGGSSAASSALAEQPAEDAAAEPAPGAPETPAEASPVGTSAASYEVGSYVEFGKYPQNNGDTPEPIEWLVLDNDGKEALLISKYGLDCQPFHHEYTSVSWRDCDLRKWLNGEFLDRAFSSEERKQIAESVINTADNSVDGTKGCWDTRDKVFCLSIEEANKYFASGDARKCQPTFYAVSRNAGKSSDGYCCFWLRSPGFYASSAANVNDIGAVIGVGDLVNDVNCAVRPALRIKL